MATDTSKIDEGIGEPNIFSQKDPKVGTGKKPKGSGRRLYTDENPKDTVSIKFATPEDARATVAKVRRVNKPYARKIQILTVGEQRAKVMGKTEVVNIFKKAKLDLKKEEMKKRETQKEDAHGFKCPSGYKFDRKLMACVPKKTRFKTVYAYPFFFGGTGLLIVVGVALDTVKQIESHLITRHYDGFSGGSGPRIRGRR